MPRRPMREENGDKNLNSDLAQDKVYTGAKDKIVVEFGKED